MCKINARITGTKAGHHFFFNYDNEPFPDHSQSLQWLLYSLLLLIWSKLLSFHLFHFHHQSSQWRILDKRHHTSWLAAVTSQIHLLFMSCFKYLCSFVFQNSLKCPCMFHLKCKWTQQATHQING
jgi:hypothetical protein